MKAFFEFQLPTRICFGENIIQKVGEEVRRLGSRVLIVTGAMAKNSGAMQKVMDFLEEAGMECALFDKVEPQPREETIERGAKVAKDARCDIVVGIGGECPLDAAKIIAVLAGEPFPLSHYFGEDKIERKPLPIIAIPLTAGSGSEVTPFSAITTENDFLEIHSVVSPFLYPTLAFVDPHFTLAFRAPVTINNGVDALSHSIEGIISKNSQPITDVLASESTRLVTTYLPMVLEEPQNMEYRSRLSYASLLGGIVASQTGVGLVHHMGYHLTLNMGKAHGEANGLVLPWACECILGREHSKLALLAKALGIQIEGSNNRESVEKVVHGIQGFISQIGVTPKTEREDLIEEKIRSYSTRVLKDMAPGLGGFRGVTQESIEMIYRKAFSL